VSDTNGRARSVLLVEDDDEIAGLLRDFLEAEGFEVRRAATGRGATEELGRARPDCILLDVMLPDESGFEICRRLRRESDLPLLFLSARDGDADKIRGLGLGGDDYIVKSARPAEIVARIKAVLRRYRRGEPAAAALLDFGRLKIDVRAREVTVAGQVVPFTAREFDLLQMLAEHPRQAFTRDQLYERIWGEYGDRHTLTVHISRLREKIERDPANPELITTVWGVGYRFEGTRR
jgi:DNA-binding response OmpR family regulator